MKENNSIKKPSVSGEQAETEFLSSYNINDYERPSIATDIAVFSMFDEHSDSHRKDAEPKLHILLIKRGEHPFMNMWALPGGFLKGDETIEECAAREIYEETNLSPISLFPVGVFSDPSRDPRGRIVSNAFVSIVNAEEVDAKCGTDAIRAEWFRIEFANDSEGVLKLKLTNGHESLTAELKETKKKFGHSSFEVISNEGIAFDHPSIIASALCSMKNEAENIEILFDFLPESFTLASLQRVQETLMGKPLLTANFRRKVCGYVTETDEFTEGIGHRPARLFKRK